MLDGFDPLWRMDVLTLECNHFAEMMSKLEKALPHFVNYFDGQMALETGSA